MNKYKHIKTGNVYTVENMKVINCNDDVQSDNYERIEILYSRNGKFFVQEKSEFLKKFIPLKISNSKKKAIIVTYAKLTDDEKELLNSTNIFKVGLNFHKYEVEVDCRVYSELFVPEGFNPQVPTVLIQASSDHKKAVRENGIQSLGSSLLDAISWLKEKGYRDILLVATNDVHADHFQEKIIKNTYELTNYVDIWQYKRANFKLPQKSIKQFINEERSGLCIL